MGRRFVQDVHQDGLVRSVLRGRPAAGFASALACCVASGWVVPAFAQDALPPVTIDPPRAAAPRPAVTPSRAAPSGPRRVARVPVRRPQPAPPVPTAAAQAPSSLGNAGGVERGDGPVNGFVATRTTSGSKTDTPLTETPQAVTVIGAEQIEALKAQSIGEATRYAPGIKSETFGNDTRNDFFLIRGFQAEQRGYYLDNLQLFSQGFATFRVEPFGLDRLEVLRGPSSVLYGGSNPGGLLNAVSKKPLFTPYNYVEFGVNEFGRTYGAFDFSGPVPMGSSPADGTFAYRMTGLMRAGGTQTDHVGDDRIYIAPAFTWKPTEATSLTILGSYTRDSTNLQNFLPYRGTVVPADFGGRIPTRTFTGDRTFDTFTRDQAFIGYQFEHRFDNDVIVRQNARYSHLDINFNAAYGFGYSNEAQAELARLKFRTVPRANVFNIDNHVEKRFDMGPLSHTVLLGLDYRRYRLDDNQATNFSDTPFVPVSDVNVLTGFQTPNAPLNKASGRYINSRFIQDQLGAYLQDQVRFGRFTLALSGRYDYVATDTNNYLDPTLSKNGEEGRFSGRAGLIYTSEIGIAPYAAYSNSFNPQVGLNGVTNRPLRSEVGEQVEVGVKYQPIGSKTFLAFSAFDLRRQSATLTNPANFLITTQTGEVRSTGIEVEAQTELTKGLNLIGSYTVYDLETTKNAVDPTVVGKRPVNTPERFGGVFLDYTIPDGPLQGFGFGGGVRFVGRSFATALNDFKVPSYTVGDAQVHYERAGWRLAVNVSNVTDETFVASCSGLTACFYGERRRVTGSVSYRW